MGQYNKRRLAKPTKGIRILSFNKKTRFYSNLFRTGYKSCSWIKKFIDNISQIFGEFENIGNLGIIMVDRLPEKYKQQNLGHTIIGI